MNATCTVLMVLINLSAVSPILEIVFLCNQRMLAGWLEQRARHMELSEKVSEERHEAIKEGKDSDTLFSIKVKRNKIYVDRT